MELAQNREFRRQHTKAGYRMNSTDFLGFLTVRWPASTKIWGFESYYNLRILLVNADHFFVSLHTILSSHFCSLICSLTQPISSKLLQFDCGINTQEDLARQLFN